MHKVAIAAATYTGMHVRETHCPKEALAVKVNGKKYNTLIP